MLLAIQDSLFRRNFLISILVGEKFCKLCIFRSSRSLCRPGLHVSEGPPGHASKAACAVPEPAEALEAFRVAGGEAVAPCCRDQQERVSFASVTGVVVGRRRSSSVLKPNTRGRRAEAARRPQHGGGRAGRRLPRSAGSSARRGAGQPSCV